MIGVKFLYGIFSIVLIIILLRIYLREGIEAKWIFIFTYSWYYFIIPFLVLILEVGKGSVLVYMTVIFSASPFDWLLAFTRCFSAAFIMILVFEGRIKNYPKNRIDVESTASTWAMKRVRIVGSVLLVVGGGSLLFLFNELGGIAQAISLGSQIRAYLSSPGDYLSAIGSMCKTLSGMVTGAGYCFLTAYTTSRKRVDKLLFIISIVLALLYLFFNAGRSNLVFFLAIYILGYCRIKNIDVMKPGIILAIIVILFSEPLGYIIDNIAHSDFSVAAMNHYAAQSNIFDNLLEFSYPVSNVLAADVLKGKYGVRFFIDYISWIPELLPARLLNAIGLNIVDVELITTQLSKFYIGMGSRGGTPVDIITLGLCQLPIMGMFINVIIFSGFAKKVGNIGKNIHKNYSYMLWFLYIFCFDLLISNDLGAMVKANLGELFVFFVLCRIEKRSISESFNNR